MSGGGGGGRGGFSRSGTSPSSTDGTTEDTTETESQTVEREGSEYQPDSPTRIAPQLIQTHQRTNTSMYSWC